MNLQVMRGMLFALKLDVENVLALLDVAIAEEAGGPTPRACPHCGEQDRIEDTSTTRERRNTCLACGASFNHSVRTEVENA